MKIKLVFVILLCLVISFVCMGCVEEKGFIMRNDITHKDFDFVFDNPKVNEKITIDDMHCLLGLPNASLLPGDAPVTVKEYSYFFDDEVFELGIITFTFDKNDKILDIEIHSYPMVYEFEPIYNGRVIIDRNEYKMVLRDDITEKELDAIDMDSTSVDVQKILRAPHDRIDNVRVNLKTDAYTYPLTNGNTFIISYERNGVIAKAWVADENKETQKVYVDRTDEFGVWEDILGEKLDDVEYN